MNKITKSEHVLLIKATIRDCPPLHVLCLQSAPAQGHPRGGKNPNDFYL